MDVLWEASDSLTVRQVSGRLTERDLAHTTVMTVLDRLSKKGFARRQRDGRAWRYRAAESREAYVTELMLSALDQTGDRQAALARFARSVAGTEAQALPRGPGALGGGARGGGRVPPRLYPRHDCHRLRSRRQRSCCRFLAPSEPGRSDRALAGS